MSERCIYKTFASFLEQKKLKSVALDCRLNRERIRVQFVKKCSSFESVLAFALLPRLGSAFVWISAAHFHVS